MRNYKFRGESRLYTVSATGRSTTLAEFKDLRGISCSIKVADTVENTILLGPEEPEIKRLIVGEGMQRVYIPEPWIISTQVSLNSSMVADLIKVLQAFVDACEEESAFEDGGDETTLILPSPTTSEPTSLSIHEAPTELPPSCSAEISECITGLSKLHNHCYQTVSSQEDKPLDSQEVRDAARSLFAQTVRNFNS